MKSAVPNSWQIFPLTCALKTLNAKSSLYLHPATQRESPPPTRRPRDGNRLKPDYIYSPEKRSNMQQVAVPFIRVVANQLHAAYIYLGGVHHMHKSFHSVQQALKVPYI